MRRALLALLVVALVVGTLSVSGLLSHRRDTKAAFEGPVRELVVFIDSGRLEVVGAEGDGARLQRTDRSLLGPLPGPTAFTDGGLLRVVGVCPGGLVLKCRTDLRIEVPPATDVELHTAGGDVAVAGITGTVRVRSGAGDIDVEKLSGFSVNVRSRGGNVDGRELSVPNVIAESLSGKLTVRLDQVPVNVSLTTTTGSIDLTVPTERYKVRAESLIGVVHVDVDVDEGSRRTIGVRAPVGDIHIRRAEAPAPSAPPP